MSNSKNIKPLLALALVVILGIGAIIFASRVNPEDIQPKADVKNLPIEKSSVPKLDTSLGWLNTKNDATPNLKNKVVVYDFWTYSCINCQRTLPYLRAIYDRYEKDGLVIVGIHSPEFDFEKDHNNVKEATKKYGVNWPVLFDDNMVNWSNFENQYWPAKYIADKQGRIRYHHYGEGRYDETEDVIRELLGVNETASRAIFPGSKDKSSGAQITPELYINPIRGVLNADQGKSTITKEEVPDVDRMSLFGSVDVQLERTVLLEKNSKLTLNYQAGEVNLVAESLTGDKKGELVVTLDSKPVPKNMRGKDLQVDDRGNTFLKLTSSDLLKVIKSQSVENHLLAFTAQSPNIALYAFTFGR